MTRTRSVALCVILLLGWTAAALAVTIARYFERGGELRLELGRTKQTALLPATLERFARLHEKVLVTYYVSRPERMPSELRHLEREVTDLLAALHARFPERFDYQIVDPESRPGLAGFAARGPHQQRARRKAVRRFREGAQQCGAVRRGERCGLLHAQLRSGIQPSGGHGYHRRAVALLILPSTLPPHKCGGMARVPN